jgi:hypothetical protein
MHDGEEVWYGVVRGDAWYQVRMTMGDGEREGIVGGR